MKTQDEMHTALRNNICEVHFTKTDGSTRVMICTLSEDILGKFEGSPSPRKEDFISVWDMEVEAWRSFKPSKVTVFDTL